MTDTSNKIKILHTSFLGSADSGIIAQLKAEIKAVSSLHLDWNILLVSPQKIIGYDESFIHKIPIIFAHNYFFKRLYYHYYLQKHLKNNNYDYILYRYIQADIFSYLFRDKYGSRFTIHHTKETDELALGNSMINKLLLFIENYFGKRFLACSNGIVAMTEDIARYELLRANKNLPYIVMPNGIDISTISLVADDRKNELNIVFVANYFYMWHGLDLLIEEIKKSNLKFNLHLIGNVPEVILNIINSSVSLKTRIIIHGYLNRSMIVCVLSKCDIGIDSLAINRKGMSEACSLKAREYLASGLPVYSGFKDSGFPADFPFYKIGKIDIEQILEYAMNMKKINREEVRAKAIPYINKTSLINNLYSFLANGLFNKFENIEPTCKL
jgi:glycosyltransferase involved in cell wall biosynthesis